MKSKNQNIEVEDLSAEISILNRESAELLQDRVLNDYGKTLTMEEAMEIMQAYMRASRDEKEQLMKKFPFMAGEIKKVFERKEKRARS